QARTGAEPVPGGPPDATLVTTAEHALARLYVIMIQVGKRRLRRPRRTFVGVQAIAKTLYAFVAFGARAGFEKGDGYTGGCQLRACRGGGNTGADKNHIVITHADAPAVAELPVTSCAQ